ncbi:MAG TPA: gas vesicle protein [Blastocatellia bacterium]
MSDSDLDLLEKSDVSLLDTLDHVLNRGLVIAGNITISIADIDLIYLGLNVVLGSVETIKEVLERSVNAAGADDSEGSTQIPDEARKPA